MKEEIKVEILRGEERKAWSSGVNAYFSTSA